ncbi:MAG: hypothetical protein MRK01_10560 [Candidatus Scalindua sp.]|nr:hypothetical protein [Candidatus Scalindua sp.]
MYTTFNSSISGIRAYGNSLDGLAHNTANINTDVYKKQHVNNLNQIRHRKVAVNITENSPPGPFYKNIKGDVMEGSKVNFIKEFVVMIKSNNQFSANPAAIIRTNANVAQKSLIDIMA